MSSKVASAPPGSVGLAKSLGVIESVPIHHPKKVVFEMICPCTIAACSEEDCFVHNWWICQKCCEFFEYAFDQYLYCKCGRSTYDSFVFKCDRKIHGENYQACSLDYLNSAFKKLKPKEDFNILILGETGVGKSTWINSIANYLTFSNLEDADKQETLTTLIGTSFRMSNENYEETEIKVGDDKNEDIVPGQSATQSPKSYTFETDKNILRLIDTPGIGDTRGVEYDKRNFDSILKYLSKLDKLNGVCILLKPNNARLTVMFRFCIKELLTHLHKDASKNIVFCFTNARSTFYKPGDSLAPLKQLMQENKNVEIVLNKNNIYCMDNEAFRFLCAKHKGIEFDDNDFKNYAASWEKSVAETYRMFEYLEALEPHKLKETISLNEARQIIVTLTKPMADIAQHIQTNIAVVEDKKLEIESCQLSEKDLERHLYIPTIELVAVQLGHPRTVCTSKSCVRYHKIPNTNQTATEYISHCHDHCYLQGVTTENYPNAELQKCAAMNQVFLNCLKCKCSWSKHMHITYEHKQTSNRVIDESVRELIKSKKSVREKSEIHITTLTQRISLLQLEQNLITNTSAKFCCFLRTNAITPYNDAMAEYLDMLIRQERDKVSAGGDRKTLDGLINNQKSYYEEVKMIESSSAEQIVHLDPSEIRRLVQQLYALPLNGKTLKATVEVAQSGRMQLMNFNEVRVRPRMPVVSQIIAWVEMKTDMIKRSIFPRPTVSYNNNRMKSTQV